MTPCQQAADAHCVVLVLVGGMAASACASAPAAEKTIEPTATEDTAFVLSRNPTARGQAGREAAGPRRRHVVALPRGLPEDDRRQGARSGQRHLGEAGTGGVLGPADLRRDDLDLDDVLQRMPRRPPQDGGRRPDADADGHLGPRRGPVLRRAAALRRDLPRSSTTARSRGRATAGRCPPGAGSCRRSRSGR